MYCLFYNLYKYPIIQAELLSNPIMQKFIFNFIGRIAQFVILGFLISSCNLQSSDHELKVEAVKAFYLATLNLREGGIPKRSSLKKLSPLISFKFNKNLQAALDAEEREFKRTKGKEPPLVQGALFYSLFEGANRIKDIRTDSKGGANEFIVELEFGDPINKKSFTKWSDRAILVKENGKWVVDDLELLGDWQFGTKGKLSTILHSIANFDQQDPTSK